MTPTLNIILVHIAFPCVIIGSSLGPSQQSSSMHLKSKTTIIIVEIHITDYWHIPLHKITIMCKNGRHCNIFTLPTAQQQKILQL